MACVIAAAGNAACRRRAYSHCRPDRSAVRWRESPLLECLGHGVAGAAAAITKPVFGIDGLAYEGLKNSQGK